MIDKSVARRYGKALFDIAAEKNKTVEYQQDLKLVVDTFKQNADFETLFLGRVISTGEKQKLVQQIFDNQISVEIKNFLCIALDKGRESYIAQILESYTELLDEAAGIIPVNVTAAISLEKKQSDSLNIAFQKKLGSPVRINSAVDASLIGGLKVQIGDTVYDGSIASQLGAMHKQLCK